MQELFSNVLTWTLLALLISTIYGQSKKITQGKGPESKNRLEISYISKPSVSAVEVVCHAYVTRNFQITCPVFDGKGLESNYFVASKAEGTCKSTDNYSRGKECIRLVRRISWQQIGTDLFNFTCFCGIKLQAVENGNNEVSVKITNQECKGTTKVFRRKINAEKNIHISCCITGQPPPEITWCKDGFELNIPFEGTVINNVRYQQKGARLIISRTDVYGSGSYQCLARNSAGHERGGTYQVIFYESKANKTNNESKQHNVITSTQLSAITHIETTEMAITFPNVGIGFKHTSEELELNFLRNTNDTLNNKEEEEEENGRQKNNIPTFAPGILALVVAVMIMVPVLLIVFRYYQKKRLSTDGNAQYSTHEVIPPFERYDHFGKSKITPLTEDSIDQKLVNVDDELELNFKESKNGFLPLPIYSSQNIACTSSKIDEAAETHLVHPNFLTPLVSTTSSCSSSIEDIKKIFEEPPVFCPIDRIPETDSSVDGADVFATNMPSPDLSTGSNTSTLLDKLITVPANADKRYSESALMDHNGGEVILTGTGIKLVIPKGAIDEGKTEVVNLALLGNPEYAPKETNDDTSLTPVVMCGPHGLRFNKHVMLVLPHCVAVSNKLEENFRVLCSETEPELAPDWKEIFNNKDEALKEVFCNMEDEHFCLFLRHFTWYNIRGKLARKFSIAAYHTSFHQPNEEFKVRIYFVPILPGCSVGQKRVDEAEEKLQGTLSDAYKIKIFHRAGGDIKVEARKISKGWQIIDQSIQTEDHSVLSSCRDEESPNRTFRFRHVNPRPEKISCKFIVLQDDCEFDTSADITMSLHFESEIKREQLRQNINNDIASVGHPSSSGFVESGESATSTAFIPTRLREDLIQLLDIEIPGVNNWEHLATRLKYKPQYIRWLKHTPELHRTELLLMKWENEVNENPEDALASLQQILLEIKRVDAATKIQDYLHRCSSRKETTV